ncbi:MAG: hypothetical protein JWR52_3354 [Marmoricola sp.]|nr:hypothetical protein [Marmoricola sp.]
MTYTSQANKRGLRRVATLLAALGMLVMSSGLVLIMSASSANSVAAPKYFVCKFVTTPGAGEHLQTGQNPIDVSANAIPEDPVVVGSSFADAQGRSFVLAQDVGQPTPDVSACVPIPKDATAAVTFVDPGCANQNTPSYSTSGDHVTFAVTAGSVAASTSVTVTATADTGHEFSDGSTSMDFTHAFGDPVNLEGPPCVIVGPPNVVTPVAPTFTDPTCDTAPSYTLPSAPVLTRKLTGPVLQTKDVLGVEYVVTGSLTSGGTVDVDATPIAPNVFATDPAPTSHWEHTFTTPTGCSTTVVSPPTQVKSVHHTAVTPTLVHAGLISTATPDLRGQRGLELMIAGLLLLVAGGGLGLVRPGGKSHS